jgi:hypothetical protein
MNWLVAWKVVVAAAALVMMINSITIAVHAARDAIQDKDCIPGVNK